ncbi:hypothetical protein H0H92_010491 [Tricholoma furcatifolium]|nr:hypothetical protein H0H92_010491 [Tricholoma furcatifolium]
MPASHGARAPILILPSFFIQAVRWEVDGIITDVTQTWLNMRAALQNDYEKTVAQYGRIFLWTTPTFYSAIQLAYGRLAQNYIEKIAGPFDAPAAAATVVEAQA